MLAQSLSPIHQLEPCQLVSEQEDALFCLFLREWEISISERNINWITIQIPGSLVRLEAQLEGPPGSGREEAKDTELCTFKDSSKDMGPRAGQSTRGLLKMHQVSASLWRIFFPHPYQERGRANNKRNQRGFGESPKQEPKNSSGSLQVHSYPQP